MLLQLIPPILLAFLLYLLMRQWAVISGDKKYGKSKAKLISIIISISIPFFLTTYAVLNLPYCISPDTPPSKESLSGLWNPNTPTIKIIKDSGYKETQQTIELKQDGTFKITSMPDMWRPAFGRSAGKYENVSGNWGVYDDGKGWMILDLDVKNINSKEMSFTYAGCSICQTDEGLTLSIGIGDPDEYNNLVFIK